MDKRDAQTYVEKVAMAETLEEKVKIMTTFFDVDHQEATMLFAPMFSLHDIISKHAITVGEHLGITDGELVELFATHCDFMTEELQKMIEEL